MTLRALGYKNVVESAGTWPTNYIAKANELQLLKDMKNVEAEDGAKSACRQKGAGDAKECGAGCASPEAAPGRATLRKLHGKRAIQ
jgi:hypothetical protein